jgi:hypothetical protein
MKSSFGGISRHKLRGKIKKSVDNKTYFESLQYKIFSVLLFFPIPIVAISLSIRWKCFCPIIFYVFLVTTHFYICYKKEQKEERYNRLSKLRINSEQT